MRVYPLLAIALLPACASVGGPGVSTYLECDRGTMLKVDPGRNGALVQVDQGRVYALRNVPSASGAAYEGGGGYRLYNKGDEWMWNGPTREAPQRCRSVAVPR